jgi:hypothetical protein
VTGCIVQLHSLAGCKDSFYYSIIAGAAAYMPGQHVANVFFRRAWVVIQEVRGRHQNASSAKPALECKEAPEIFLQLRQGVIGQPFDGLNAAPFDLNGIQQTGSNGPAIDQDGTRPTYAVLAANVSTEFMTSVP